MLQIGTDIIENARIKRAITRWGVKFLHRIYTKSELDLYQDKISSLAARFAGKEAVMKALSARNKGIAWKEIEILCDANGKPTIKLYGRAKKQAAIMRLNKLSISLSHSREYAIAFVAGEIKP